MSGANSSTTGVFIGSTSLPVSLNECLFYTSPLSLLGNGNFTQNVTRNFSSQKQLNSCLVNSNFSSSIWNPNATLVIEGAYSFPFYVPPTSGPSSLYPTTAYPTSLTPTFLAPSTQKPSTSLPSTFLPSTQTPTSVTPSTQTPTSVTPSTQPPSTFLPSTQVPPTPSPLTLPPTLSPTNSPTTSSPTTSIASTSSVSSSTSSTASSSTYTSSTTGTVTSGSSTASSSSSSGSSSSSSSTTSSTTSGSSSTTGSSPQNFKVQLFNGSSCSPSSSLGTFYSQTSSCFLIPSSVSNILSFTSLQVTPSQTSLYDVNVFNSTTCTTGGLTVGTVSIDNLCHNSLTGTFSYIISSSASFLSFSLFAFFVVLFFFL